MAKFNAYTLASDVHDGQDGANSTANTIVELQHSGNTLFINPGDPTTPLNGASWTIASGDDPVWLAIRVKTTDSADVVTYSDWDVSQIRGADGGVSLASYTISGVNSPPTLGDTTWSAHALAAVRNFTGDSSIQAAPYGTTVTIYYPDSNTGIDRISGTNTKNNGWITPAGVIPGILLVDGTVVADKVASNTIETRHFRSRGPTYNGVDGFTIIEDGSIVTDLIKTGAITADKVLAGTITATEIASNTITATEIASNTITATEIDATNLKVTSANITGTLTANQINATNLQIDAGNVTGTLTASQINATNLQVAAANITGTLTVGQINVTASEIGGISSGGAALDINGNSTTINGNKITTGTLEVDTIKSGTTTSLATGTSFGLGATTDVQGHPALIAATTTGITRHAVIAAVDSSTNEVTAVLGLATGTGTGVAGYNGYTSSSYSVGNSTRSGILAAASSAGSFTNSNVITSQVPEGNSNTVIATDSGFAISSVASANFNLDLQVGRNVRVGGVQVHFTGGHTALLPKTATVSVGDILLDTGVIVGDTTDVSNATSKVILSSSSNQKGALGVYVEQTDSLPRTLTEMDDSDIPVAIIKDEYVSLLEDNDVVIANAVGEGRINVIGEAGDLEIGDLIVTSSTAGKGMKQSDDLVRGYTVAKSRENVTFSSDTEVKLVACIYLCG